MSNARIFGFPANAQEYNRKVAERRQRLGRLHLELLDETMKPGLDPAALGARSLETELIRRDIRDAALAPRIQKLEPLTATQRAELKAIEDALRLLPPAAGLQSENITGDWVSPPAGFNPIGTAPAMPLRFFGVPGPLQGCVDSGVLTPR